ncbi:MAG: T9SS C-terminal target domain-containing protein [Verrucomicrobiota bacterium]
MTISAPHPPAAAPASASAVKRIRSIAAGCGLLLPMSVTAGELKVDINRDSKNSDSVTETGFTKWSTAAGYGTTGTAATSSSFTSLTGETVVIGFSQTDLSASRGGAGLLTNWYQTGAQGAARLVSDGFTVSPANLATGGEIRMTITGLSAGRHTLLTYHNHWDALAAGTLGSINVSVNGVPAVSNLQPTIRAATTALAPVAYVEFGVGGPSDVTTILFSAETATGGTVTIRNPVINGFEIDTPNSTRIANSPSPADADEHVNADTGSTTLSWAPATAGTAVSHDVYFGTSPDAVKNADRSSSEFKGNQTALTYNATGIASLPTCCWRIDEIDSVGNAVKGTVWHFRPRHLAFPGAEGYGRYARGGRGGVVVEVTNLNDSGPGSLRDALTGNHGPRTVVFTVSGLITLDSHLTISQPYITLAGQTAPGKGISTRNYSLGMSGGKDVIIRHIRSRPGNTAGITLNGSGMAGSDHCIMDHCSVSWGIDEEISTRSSKNVTLQRVLISEALNVAGHSNYPAGTAHGYAASIGGDVGSFHHNLLAHNAGRNWSMAGGLDGAGYFSGKLDIFNNVVYNWDSRTTDGGAHEVNFVNNYYKPGAATTHFFALTANYDNFPGTQRYHIAGNVMPGRFTETQNTEGLAYREVPSNGGSLPSYQNFMAVPFFPSHATTHTADDAFKLVLSDVGCNQPFLDDHDVRVVKETLNGTYTYSGSVSGKPGLPDSQNDVGGWENYFQQSRPADWDSDHDGLPNWWESHAASNPHSTAGDFSDSNSDPDDDGYTALETYLNWMAAPHAATSPDLPVRIDLSPYAAGFSSPAYTVSAAVGGSIVLLADSRTALFSPSPGFSGLASFNFTLTSGTTTVTRAVGVTVSTQAAAAFERRWRGRANSSWDAVSNNWIDGSTIGGFQSGTAVIFDDTGAAVPNVVLSGVLRPAAVTVTGPVNYTFSGGGSLSGSMALAKSGSGTLTITGSHSFTGGTTLGGGKLVLNGALDGGPLSVKSGAALSGIGTLTGNLTIGPGGLVALGSGTMTVNGDVANNGTIRLTSGASLAVSGTFTNHGLLDIMTGAPVLPAGFVNLGTVLDSSSVRVAAAGRSGQNFTVTIHGYEGHGYQMQAADTLTGPWTAVGAKQSGFGSTLTFTDNGGATGARKFYRISVFP